jgi:ABC-type nitrate/sulfonate/bicarbonate transport system ATPase subunit
MTTVSTTIRVPGRPTLLINDLQITGGNELILVLGPNGSGKTTLCQTLAGVVAESYCDPPIPFSRACPILVWQDHQLFPLSVVDNVRIVSDRQRATELLRRFNLLALKDRPASDLSGGERVRLAIARAVAALSPSTPILIFDEPTASVDARYTADIADCILKAHHLAARDHLARIVVTHDARLMALLSTALPSIYVLEPRRAQDETILESQLWGPWPAGSFHASPPTVFAAEFLGYENIFRLKDPDGPIAFGNLQAYSRIGGASCGSAMVPGGKYVAIPRRACRIADAEPTSGWERLPVDLEAVEFRADGLRVARCRSEPAGGSNPLEFIAVVSSDFSQTRSRCYLEFQVAECKRIDQR